jgi:putative glutamine amidotransferase
LRAKTVFIYGTGADYPNYTAALLRAGARPMVSRDLHLALHCDCLLLPGGGDIHGALDATEEYLIQSFAESTRPILGICRGMQALNVYFGGTLHDWIPGHQSPTGDLLHGTRTQGLLRRLLGDAPTVNSNHHQAADTLGQGLYPLQWAPDGILEALGHQVLPILGVQWHPERLAGGEVLFNYFLSDEVFL